jgi:DNA-directed RNA polymerase specialized sigma24 family protein
VIVRLAHLDGLTHTDSAETLRLALGTVKSRSNRAHRRVAARLADLQPDALDGAKRDSRVASADVDDEDDRVR